MVYGRTKLQAKIICPLAINQKESQQSNTSLLFPPVYLQSKPTTTAVTSEQSHQLRNF